MNDPHDAQAPPGRRRTGASPQQIADPLIELLERELVHRAALFVALDGRSGAGKSTVATVVAAQLRVPSGVSPAVLVIEGDQFYAGGSASSWDARSPVERADRVIDWRRQRALLHQLRDEGVGVWQRFDWDAEDWDSEGPPLHPDPIRSAVAPLVLLEGAYSARPELHDLLDLRVLLDVATDRRRQQLLAREGEEYRSDWETRWSTAEDHYFGSVMPPNRFDLILGQP